MEGSITKIHFIANCQTHHPTTNKTSIKISSILVPILWRFEKKINDTIDVFQSSGTKKIFADNEYILYIYSIFHSIDDIFILPRRPLISFDVHDRLLDNKSARSIRYDFCPKNGL